MSMLILVLGNPLNHEGGMVAFNKGLISTLNPKSKTYQLEHFSIGSRMSLFYKPILKRLVYPILLIVDLFRLFIKLFNKDVKIIQMNPSLIPVPLIRDGLVQFVNRVFFRKKSVIVLHGWKDHVFIKLMSNKFYGIILKKFFNSADEIFVLSEELKTKLTSLGVNRLKIKVTRTFFYKEAIQAIPVTKSIDYHVSFIFLV